MRRFIVGLALVLMLAWIVGANQSSAATIFYDDFESEPVPPIPPSGYIGNYDGFVNWDVVGSGVDLFNSLFVNSIVVDLDGTSGSTLITKQVFQLMPNMYYTLTFDLVGPRGGMPLDTVVVELGNVLNESITLDQGAPLQTYIRTITVTSPTTGNLSFTDLGADSNGALLDNVQLEESVPEPTTPIMLLMGATALLFKRRK